jgi:hypothetical protein
MGEIAYRLTLACKYEGTLQLFNYVHAYAYTVYTKYTAYAYISALKQLGRPIATGWSALQDGAVSGIQDFERL